MKIRSETAPVYNVNQTEAGHSEDQIIEKALEIMMRRMRTIGEGMNSPNTVKDFLKLKTAHLEHEVFSCLFLDNQNQVIAFEEMFRGTASQASVYPREIVKTALKHNASAVVFSHNHPSQEPTPSRADRSLTDTLKTALAMVDVRVLDHIIVGGMKPAYSFAEAGLI